MPRLLLVLLTLVGCAARSTAVQPGINAPFLDPALDVAVWMQRFEGESREVFASSSAIVEALALAPGERIADIGAGTGLFVKPFAEAVGEQGHVFAVDISPRFLRHLEERFAGDDRVSVVEGTVHSVGLAPDSVDAAFVCDTYHHFDHPAETLASLASALRPGGHLYVLDFERIPGVSSQWILDHVRADKQTFTAEIVAAGFVLEEDMEVRGLAQNYLLRFRSDGP